jgi:hypothetical protein
VRKTLVGGAIVCSMFVVFEAGPAQAQEREDERDGASRPAVEVTPFVSMGSARSSRIGAAIAFAWTEKLSIEAEMGYRKGEGDLNFLNSSASLLYALPRIGRANPYLAAGVGLEQYGTGEHIPGYGVATLRQTALTVNAGGGVKVPISGPIGFRSDARWVKGFGRTAGEHWRMYNGMTVAMGR